MNKSEVDQMKSNINEHENNAMAHYAIKGGLDATIISQAVDDIMSTIVKGTIPAESLLNLVKESAKVDLHSPNKLNDLIEYLERTYGEEPKTFQIVETKTNLPLFHNRDLELSKKIKEVKQIVDDLNKKYSDILPLIKELDIIRNILKEINYENN